MNNNIPRKRLTATGTIQKKKNNAGTIYYQVIRFPFTYDLSGNIVYKKSPCFHTKSEARIYQNQLIMEREKYRDVSPDNPSVYSMAKLYTETYILPRHQSCGGRDVYKLNIRRMKNIFDAVGIKDCMPEQLQSFLNELNKKTTARYAHTILFNTFRWLENTRRIQYNPMNAISLPKHIPKRKIDRSPLTPLELKLLTEYLEQSDDILVKRYRHLIYLQLSTGMRTAEVLGTRWDNIDWKNHTIKITHTVVTELDSYSRRIKKGGKNKNAIRVVPLNPHTYSILKKHYALYKDSEWIAETYHHNKKLPIHKMPYERIVRQICERAGIKRHISPYIFRHTFTTYAVRAGIPITELRYITGHSDTSMILKVYANHIVDNVIKHNESKLCHMYGDAVIP
jgi:integrase